MMQVIIRYAGYRRIVRITRYSSAISTLCEAATDNSLLPPRLNRTGIAFGRLLVSEYNDWLLVLAQKEDQTLTHRENSRNKKHGRVSIWAHEWHSRRQHLRRSCTLSPTSRHWETSANFPWQLYDQGNLERACVPSI